MSLKVLKLGREKGVALGNCKAVFEEGEASL
jgi:hypothetical protein